MPDDWLEPSERAEKRKQAKQEAKARKEARAKEEAKMKADIAKSEATEEVGEKKENAEDSPKVESGTSEEAKGVDEEGAGSSAKRERERETDDGLEDEEELDDTPPMYRQARGLFLKPEVRIAFMLSSSQARGMLYVGPRLLCCVHSLTPRAASSI